MKELDATNGIAGRQASVDAPGEKRFQHTQVLVGGTPLHRLRSSQFDVLDLGSADSGQELLRSQPRSHIFRTGST
jgi:hypothetical protein